MNKDEILETSRKENKNKDLVELDVISHAGNIAGRVGACVCCLISLIAQMITNTFLYSPWVIYFSILGTHSLVKYIKLKKGSDLLLSAMYFLICISGFIFFVLRLIGGKS